MNNLDKIIEITQKAVLESGKSFENIDKNSILKYLESKGISNSALRESVYQSFFDQLLSEMNSKPVAKPVDTKVKTSSDVPKQPRKSVFGEIKRIA
jgi:hypothetical protein